MLDDTKKRHMTVSYDTQNVSNKRHLTLKTSHDTKEKLGNTMFIIMFLAIVLLLPIYVSLSTNVYLSVYLYN